MATNEQIILDPPEVSEGRVALDITDWIALEGFNWGDAEIAAYMSEQRRGAVPIDYRVPPRIVGGPLMLAEPKGGVTAQEFRAKLQHKVALFQDEGGWLKRVTNNGGVVFADIVDAKLHATSVSGLESSRGWEMATTLELTLIPDFYEEEIEVATDFSETGQAELVFELTGLRGDYASRCRIVVDNDHTADYRGLAAAFRSRNYDSANTAALDYEAEALEPLGNAIIDNQSGDSGSSVSYAAGAVFPVWMPMLGTNIGGTTPLTHVGSYGVLARMRARYQDDICYARFRWGIGDLTDSIINDRVLIPSGDGSGYAWHYVDLGAIRIDQSPVGQHRWYGVVEVFSEEAISGVDIDKIWFVPLDEFHAQVTTGLDEASDQTLIAFDDLIGTAGGTVSADTAGLGGNWDSFGDITPEFVYEADGSGVRRYRSAADADPQSGCFLLLDGSSTISEVDVSTQVNIPIIHGESSSTHTVRAGVVARYVDANNWLMLCREHRTTNAARFLRLVKRVAGVVSTIGYWKLSSNQNEGDHVVRLTVDVNGNVICYSGAYGSTDRDVKIAVYDDNDLKAGGALDDGKIGIYATSTLVAATGFRDYIRFAPLNATAGPVGFRAFSGGLSPDAVIFSGQSIQLSTDGIFRESADGGSYTEIIPDGDLPRLPVSGLEGRTTQVFLKPTVGNFSNIQDQTVDLPLSAKVFYRPCWLFVDDT